MRTEITPLDGVFEIDEWAGDGTEYFLDIGPVGFSKGWNVTPETRGRARLLESNAADYYTGGFGIDKGIKNFKLKPKLSIGGGVSFGKTWLFNKSIFESQEEMNQNQN